MKILTFNYEYPPLGGGGGVVHASIAEELAKRHRVCVITSAWRDLPPHEIRNGVEIHRVPVLGRKDISAASLTSMLSYPPSAWLRAFGLLRAERFDLINSHFAVPTGPGSLLPAKVAGLPHVLSLHGGDIYDPSKKLSPHRLPLVRLAVTWALRRSDAVVAQSMNTRQNTYRYYRYRGPIEVIPLGIKQPAADPASRGQLNLPERVFLAVTVGRLVKRKAIEQLLLVLAKPECSAIHLVVVGDGPERARLLQLRAELDLQARVIFTGRVGEAEKWQILRCADAYVSTTLHEGFGLVYLEAMAAGLPVVTFDHGGQVDFLRDGETGYLVPLGDVDGIVRAVGRLADEPELARRMGGDNLRRAPDHRIERTAALYEALFERLLRRVSPPGEPDQPVSPAERQERVQTGEAPQEGIQHREQAQFLAMPRQLLLRDDRSLERPGHAIRATPAPLIGGIQSDIEQLGERATVGPLLLHHECRIQQGCQGSARVTGSHVPVLLTGQA